MTAAPPGIAVVVPVLDDTPAVRRLFDEIASWSTAPREVVVVAGRADPALERLCRDRGYRALVMPPNRGAQLDRGARETRSPALWFLHADLLVPRDGIDAAAAALAAGAEGGCFRFDFQGPRTWYKSLLAVLVALRVHCGGVPYGDQALFVSREAYEQCGGFAHRPLFEEVDLVRRLRKCGRFRLLSDRAAVSTRRWERDGWWRRTLHNRWLAVCYMLGVPPERLAGAYSPFKRRSTRKDRPTHS